MPHREDALRVPPVALDLDAQPVDMGVDGVLLPFVLIAPDLIQQAQA